MELKNPYYVISRETLEKVLQVLGNHWFSSDSSDYGERNNEDIIEVDELLQAEIKSQVND